MTRFGLSKWNISSSVSRRQSLMPCSSYFSDFGVVFFLFLKVIFTFFFFGKRKWILLSICALLSHNLIKLRKATLGYSSFWSRILFCPPLLLCSYITGCYNPYALYLLEHILLMCTHAPFSAFLINQPFPTNFCVFHWNGVLASCHWQPMAYVNWWTPPLLQVQQGLHTRRFSPLFYSASCSSLPSVDPCFCSGGGYTPLTHNSIIQKCPQRGCRCSCIRRIKEKKKEKRNKKERKKWNKQTKLKERKKKK